MITVLLPVKDSTDVIILFFNPDGPRSASFRMTRTEFDKFRESLQTAGQADLSKGYLL